MKTNLLPAAPLVPTVNNARRVARLLIGASMLTACTAFAGGATNTYDSLGRLTTVTYANGVVITYVYDAAGNRTKYTVVRP